MERKIDIHFSQKVPNSKTHLMSIKSKSKYIRFDNFDYRIKCKKLFFILIILVKVFEMLNIKSYPFSPSEHKDCLEEDVLEKKENLVRKLLKISQKCCHASIDINIYIIFGSLYSLWYIVHEVNFILGHPVPLKSSQHRVINGWNIVYGSDIV